MARTKGGDRRITGGARPDAKKMSERRKKADFEEDTTAVDANKSARDANVAERAGRFFAAVQDLARISLRNLETGGEAAPSAGEVDRLVKMVKDGRTRQLAPILAKESPDKVLKAAATSLLSGGGGASREEESAAGPARVLLNCLRACRVQQDEEDDRRKLEDLRYRLHAKALQLLMRNDFLSDRSASSALDALAAEQGELSAVDVLRLVGQCGLEIKESKDRLKTRWFSFLARVSEGFEIFLEVWSFGVFLFKYLHFFT